MRILFCHGWTSVPGGVKPSYLRAHGHDILNPQLPDEDFPEAVAIAQRLFDRYHPPVVVGSSRGGAVAMNLVADSARLVLLCPAWKRWGRVQVVAEGTTILHSRDDEVIPFEDSLELLTNSFLSKSALLEVGSDHRLADRKSLTAMLNACESS